VRRSNIVRDSPPSIDLSASASAAAAAAVGRENMDRGIADETVFVRSELCAGMGLVL